MDVVQDLRYKLQKRVTRILGTDPEGFTAELIRFWDYFDGNSTLTSIAKELARQFPAIGAEIDQMSNNSTIYGATEAENAAIGYEILRRCAKLEGQGFTFMNYVRFGGSLRETLDDCRTAYLEPFYEYVDEHLQDRNLVLDHLIRFKHLAEWFRRDELWEAYSKDSRLGEKRLAFKVYEYLYEQGISFSIEPTSASGEADMVGIQDKKNPLVAEVKIFDPSGGRGPSYIAKGFHQVHRYLQDFNKTVGYLVVFKLVDRNIRLEGAEGDFPWVQIGHKTIFMVDIDIYPHVEPASRRGLSEEDVIPSSELKAELPGSID